MKRLVCGDDDQMSMRRVKQPFSRRICTSQPSKLMSFGHSYKKKRGTRRSRYWRTLGMCASQDRPSRFIAACATGRIGDDLGEQAVTLTVERTPGRALTRVERWVARLCT